MVVPQERRFSPRIKKKLKGNIRENIPAEIIDFSEKGARFNSIEKIFAPTVSLSISFPYRKFELKTEAKLIWRRDLESGTSSYGVEFIDLDESQEIALRRELIKAQIKGLLSEVKDSRVKKEIRHFFLKDVLEYITKITKLLPYLSEREYSLELEKKLERLNIEILLKGYCLELLLSDKGIMRKVKDNFRQLAGTWIYKSIIVKRAFDKRKSYQGDYKMLEFIYENRVISKSIGRYLDNTFLKSPYAVGIRLRKDKIRELLLKFIKEIDRREINILSIPCGSCREIRELATDIPSEKIIIFTCVDSDEEALRFSQDKIKKLPFKNLEFTFFRKDILGVLNNTTGKEILAGQDIIYSVGLFDYLPDRVFKKLFSLLFKLLKPEGKLIITHQNREKTFAPIFPDWYCGWKFVPRSKEEVANLLYNVSLPNLSLSVISDDFGYIYYFTVSKR